MLRLRRSCVETFYSSAGLPQDGASPGENGSLTGNTCRRPEHLSACSTPSLKSEDEDHSRFSKIGAIYASLLMGLYLQSGGVKFVKVPCRPIQHGRKYLLTAKRHQQIRISSRRNQPREPTMLPWCARRNKICATPALLKRLALSTSSQLHYLLSLDKRVGPLSSQEAATEAPGTFAPSIAYADHG
jgi:hypothetical protein